MNTRVKTPLSIEVGIPQGSPESLKKALERQLARVYSALAYTLTIKPNLCYTLLPL